MRIVSDYPVWFFLICIILGIVYTAILYWRSKRVKELPKVVSVTLCILSFLSVSLIALLLFSPFIKRNITHTEKPVIVFAQDNTRSLLSTQDSAFYSAEYPKQVNDLIKRLSRKYDVQTYNFSGNSTQEDLSYSYSGEETNIANILYNVNEKYLNRNLGAVLLATDGIYNQGSNPLIHTESYSFPVYSIALGDTTIKKDAKISSILYNKITYLGNSFPIEFTVLGDKLKGQNATIKVYDNEGILLSKNVHFTSDRFEHTETLLIEAKKPGVQKYTIEISSVEGEISLENNKRIIFVDVIDKKQKIALIAGAPHPDISAIKQVIDDYEGYEIESALLKDFKEPVNNYNLLILHQLPSNGNQDINLIQSALDNQIPILFIIGLQTDINRFNQLKSGLTITSNINKHSENLTVINNSFPLFTLDEQLKKKIEAFPPLLSRFGTYQLATNAQTLAYAKIGNITTQQPVISFAQLEGNRVGFICGEGLWKWRMLDYLQNETNENFNTLLNKIIQYLSSKNNKSRFIINHKKVFKENEVISFEAEFYNESYEPINTPEISITLYDENNNPTEFFFNKTTSAYYVNIGTLIPESYKYKASTVFNGLNFTLNGEIIVEEINLEEINLVADHTMLYTLSQRTGGKLVYPNDMDQIERLLEEREDIKPISYFQKEYTEMLNLPWLFVFILLLLSVHWFIRKYNGFI